MNAAELFTLLYPIVPLVGLAGYVPQIIVLARMREAPRSISMVTWFVWLSTWVIGLGYAVFALQDLLLSITCGMNVAGHLLVIGMTFYKRLKYDSAAAALKSSLT